MANGDEEVLLSVLQAYPVVRAISEKAKSTWIAADDAALLLRFFHSLVNEIQIRPGLWVCPPRRRGDQHPLFFYPDKAKDSKKPDDAVKLDISSGGNTGILLYDAEYCLGQTYNEHKHEAIGLSARRFRLYRRDPSGKVIAKRTHPNWKGVEVSPGVSLIQVVYDKPRDDDAESCLLGYLGLPPQPHQMFVDPTMNLNLFDDANFEPASSISASSSISGSPAPSVSAGSPALFVPAGPAAVPRRLDVPASSAADPEKKRKGTRGGDTANADMRESVNSLHEDVAQLKSTVSVIQQEHIALQHGQVLQGQVNLSVQQSIQILRDNHADFHRKHTALAEHVDDGFGDLGENVHVLSERFASMQVRQTTGPAAASAQNYAMNAPLSPGSALARAFHQAPSPPASPQQSPFNCNGSPSSSYLPSSPLSVHWLPSTPPSTLIPYPTTATDPAPDDLLAEKVLLFLSQQPPGVFCKPQDIHRHYDREHAVSVINKTLYTLKKAGLVERDNEEGMPAPKWRLKR